MTKTKALLACLAILTPMAAKAITINDLTSGGSATINGAVFTTTDNASTGTGLIQSFVRVQDNGVADGYNATARPVMGDVNTSPQFTHDIQLSSVPLVVRGGVSYYEFLLDINQQNNNPLLSLDKVDIYTRATALSAAGTLAALTSGAAPVYSLDGAPSGDNEILLNYSLNSGSGSGDLFAYIPQSVFGSTSDYVYLYSMFGNKGGNYEENDGFEEWAVRTPTTTTQVPDGGMTVALLGAGILGLGAMRRKLS